MLRGNGVKKWVEMGKIWVASDGKGRCGNREEMGRGDGEGRKRRNGSRNGYRGRCLGNGEEMVSDGRKGGNWVKRWVVMGSEGMGE